jgi:hypothetical protein
MNWDAVGALAEIIGALGVLVTLIYLATQIRDNTRSLQAASLQSVLEGPRDRYFLPMAQSDDMADIYARGLSSLDLLDAREKRRFFFMMYEQLFQMQQVWQLRERDLIPQVDYDAWLEYTISLTRTPGGAEMWPICRSVITPTIADVIDEGLRRYADRPSFIEHVPLFDESRGDRDEP